MPEEIKSRNDKVPKERERIKMRDELGERIAQLAGVECAKKNLIERPLVLARSSVLLDEQLKLHNLFCSASRLVWRIKGHWTDSRREVEAL